MSVDVQLRGSMVATWATTVFPDESMEEKSVHLFLKDALQADGHDVQQAENDAGTMIVACVLELCREDLTVVVSDDTDVLVLMVHHFSEDMKALSFFSEASARSKKQYSSPAFQQ